MINHITKSILILILSVSCCSSNVIAENNVQEITSSEENVIASNETTTNETIVVAESTDPKTSTLDSITVPEDHVDHTLWNDLLSKHVTATGAVNYKGFIKDKKPFKEYLTILSENEPQKDWTKEETLAYWMNVYNAFTIKLITDNYPVNSIKDIKDPWDKRFFKIGSKWRNLNEIEHKILRKMEDPRIHFGINCASISCPTLHNKAFTAGNVDTTLDMLAAKFINNPKHNTITKNTAKLSKIFKWFSKDFKTNGSIIDYLNQYSAITIDANAKISYKEYNWSLNE